VSAPVPGCPGCAALVVELVELRAQIAELTARLNQNSGNSSQPPSADPPEVRANRPKSPPSDRKPGGQRGHKGTTRCDFPPEMVDETVECFPEQCGRCGTALHQEPLSEDPPPQVHQVADLPPKLKLHVQEFRLHARNCPCCGKRTWAGLPAGVPRGHWGPGLQALAALLVGYFHLSRRRAQEFLTTLFGHAPCLGTLVALETATVAALAPAVTEVERAVQAAGSVNVDETGWRKPRDRLTLWVVVAGALAVFRVGRRDRQMFQKLLPAGVDRVVTSDRYAVYESVAAAWRQLCWAHLRRNFQALVDLGNPTGLAVGNWALAEIRRLFHCWHEFQRGEISREELRRRLLPIQQGFRAALGLGTTGSCRQTARLCRGLEERWESLWTFAEREGVEPTNNAAERALRPAVLWRKRSFGHQSEGGQAFVETMLTVGVSLRLQGRPALPFVRAVCEAALTGGTVPSLLPAA